ncbi:DUF3265 domain-containing protein [Vibrio campbellii]
MVQKRYDHHLTAHITNCLRVIRNAWHFYYALVLVSEVVCVSMEV